MIVFNTHTHTHTHTERERETCEYTYTHGTRANKGIQQSCRIQDQHTKSGYVYTLAVKNPRRKLEKQLYLHDNPQKI